LANWAAAVKLMDAAPMASNDRIIFFMVKVLLRMKIGFKKV
jgi:hypothetical protein